MSYPQTKEEVYAFSGVLVGRLIHEMGEPIDQSVADSWGGIMHRLASADEMSEQSPEMLDAAGLLALLGLEPTFPLLRSSSQLLNAAKDSAEAKTLPIHLNARCEEADRTVELLRFSGPSELSRNEYLWTQVTYVSRVGILVDSIIDAAIDSSCLPFEPFQIRIKAANRAIFESMRLDRKTIFATLRSLGYFGLSIGSVPKAVKTLLHAT